MKSRRIFYWISTALLALAMAGSATMKLTRAEPLVQGMEHLGFPSYMMTILGVWYAGAAIALLIPAMPRIKEWAYAGITFALTGAVFSHLAMGDPVAQWAPLPVLLLLTAASYVLRPDDRRLHPLESSSGNAE